MTYAKQVSEALRTLGIEGPQKGGSLGTSFFGSGEVIESYSPADGQRVGTVQAVTRQEFLQTISKAQEAFRYWRKVPAPQRGEIIRQIGLELRKYKEALGTLVTYEMGKIYQEGLGEVQEMIDMADFAVGLSRQLYGLTIASERPDHRLMEQWHPLGPVGIITSFNFPVAVYAWNAFVAAVCGDTVVWKPSEKTPLSAVAVQKIIARVLERNGIPEGVFTLVTGGREVGEWIADEPRLPLVSATGSIRMGRSVGQRVAARLGRTILELGGNNAAIVTPHANQDLALRAIVFGAVGTAGQRCTTTRRLILHEAIYDEFLEKLLNVYRQLRIGHPLDPTTHIGPLIDEQAVQVYLNALDTVREQGGRFLLEGGRIDGMPSPYYVAPSVAEMPEQMPITCEETFAPLLYVLKYRDLEEAIALNNAVPQGLSSAIFSDNFRECEYFLSPEGSDCGIANVNAGTSGAEIGGAFGGEKDTGGGREAGSDSWKAYMRRQTNTINYGTDLPLAQGIKFEI